MTDLENCTNPVSCIYHQVLEKFPIFEKYTILRISKEFGNFPEVVTTNLIPLLNISLYKMLLFFLSPLYPCFYLYTTPCIHAIILYLPLYSCYYFYISPCIHAIIFISPPVSMLLFLYHPLYSCNYFYISPCIHAIIFLSPLF